MRIMPAIQLLLDTGLPGPSSTMAPGDLDQTGYGRAYGEDVDEVHIDFENPGEDLVLFVKGFDVDSDTEIEILMNGQSIGFLSEGLNDGLSGGNAFTLEMANMLPGTNRITFRVAPPGENWGVAEIELETVPQYNTREEWLGLPMLFDEEWTEVSVRQVLDVLAYGGLTTDFQMKTWANMRPADAIVEMLNFSQHNLKLAPVAPIETYPDAQSNYGTLWSFSEDYLGNPATNLPVPRIRSGVGRERTMALHVIGLCLRRGLDTHGLDPWIEPVPPEDRSVGDQLPHGDQPQYRGE